MGGCTPINTMQQKEQTRRTWCNMGNAKEGRKQRNLWHQIIVSTKILFTQNSTTSSRRMSTKRGTNKKRAGTYRMSSMGSSRERTKCIKGGLSDDKMLWIRASVNVPFHTQGGRNYRPYMCTCSLQLWQLFSHEERAWGCAGSSREWVVGVGRLPLGWILVMVDWRQRAAFSDVY